MPVEAINPEIQSRLLEVLARMPRRAVKAAADPAAGMAVDPGVASAPALAGPGGGADPASAAAAAMGQVQAQAAAKPAKLTQDQFNLLLLKLAQDNNRLLRQLVEAANGDPGEAAIGPDDAMGMVGLAGPGGDAEAAAPPPEAAAPPPEAAAPPAKTAGYAGEASDLPDPEAQPSPLPPGRDLLLAKLRSIKGGRS